MYNELFGKNSPGNSGSRSPSRSSRSPNLKLLSRKVRRRDNRVPSRVPSRVSRARTRRVKDIVKEFDVSQVSTVIKSMSGEDTTLMVHGLRVRISRNPYFREKTIFIEFLNLKDEVCIFLEYTPETHSIHLHSYYFYTKIHECIAMPNDWFFNDFLIKLCIQLRVTSVTLYDASYKVFPECNIPSLVFAFAYGTTFYQKYGFTNWEYKTFIEEKQDLTMLQYLENTTLPVSEAVKISYVHLFTSLGLLHSTVKEVCLLLIEYCKNGLLFTEDNFEKILFCIKRYFTVKNHNWVLRFSHWSE